MTLHKLIYWTFTAVLCGIFIFSAGMYLLKYDMVKGLFIYLGFPIWLIYPLAAVKVLAVIAIISNKSIFLKEWAYAALFFEALLATAAHLIAGDSLPFLSILAIIAVAGSRFFNTRRSRL